MSNKVSEVESQTDSSSNRALSFSHLFNLTDGESEKTAPISITPSEPLCEEPLASSLPSDYNEFIRYSDNFNIESSKTIDGLSNFTPSDFPSNYDPNFTIRDIASLHAKPSFSRNRIEKQEPESSSYGTFQSQTSGCDVVLGDGSVARWRAGLSFSFDPNRITLNESTSTNIKHQKTHLSASKTNPSSEFPSISQKGSAASFNLFEWLNSLTPANKSVIKSTLSYFIGSLLTFIPVLRSIIGTSSHMAAISGFFLNPGMSIGKFVETMVFGIGFVAYGLTVGYLSLVNMAFWNRNGYPEVARKSTLFIFIGVASFILAYIKARFPKPTVIKCIPNAFIFIYLVLVNYTPFVKDTYDPFKIYDLAKTLTCGIIINFIVCTQLWPRWEADKLRHDMSATLNSFHTSLHAIVQTFLLETRDGKGIDTIMEDHRKSFLSLKQRYEASHWEFTLEPERYQLLGAILDRLNKLSQKMGGLSSGIDAQKEILQDSGVDCWRHSKFPQFMNKQNKSDVVVDIQQGSPKEGLEPEPDVEVLMAFLKFVSLPTKSLAYTCQQAILHLSQSVNLNPSVKGSEPQWEENGHTRSEAVSPSQLRENITNALAIFSKAQSKAMSTLYRRTRYDGRPDEEIFLVYFFVFSLEEFANELLLTISAIESYNSSPKLTGSQWWIILRTTFLALGEITHSLWSAAYQKIPSNQAAAAHTNIPLHTPTPHTCKERLCTQIWYFLMALRDHRIIFAGKSAFAAMLIASPIYLGDYKQLFREWRVGWVLITVNLVMSPTLGASNIYGLYRSLGTLVGSCVAFIVYSILSHDPIGLAIVSTSVAAPCMYMFLNTSYPRFGQFLLLSYNLIVLTTYANRHDVEFSFAEYALIRTFSVLLGVVVGLLFSFFVLPYEARRELRIGLSSYFVKTSLLYQKLVSMYSLPASPQTSLYNTPSTFLNEDPTYVASVSNFLELELELQVQLLDLGGLLANTAHEPRLKGPFPTATYRQILKSCQFLLDKFVAMRIVITKDEWSSRVREDFVVPLNKYRADLVGAIILYFYILASALHLKSPLPPYLPPAALARRRLIEALRNLPVVRNRYLHQDDDHHIMYYAFIVVLDDIISELEVLGTLFKQLYGCQNEAAFAELFRTGR